MTTTAATPLGQTVRTALLGLGLLAIADCRAADASRMEALQQQVEELRGRVQRLEAQMQAGVPAHPVRKVRPVSGGWREAANWGLLAKGLSDYEVEEILGEPQGRKTVNKYEFWHYGDGIARFYLGRLKSWESPDGIE